MRLIIFLLFISLNFPLIIQAQEEPHCATTAVLERRKKAFPQLKDEMAFEQWMKKKLVVRRALKRATEQENTFIIPVIVHIVHNGEDIGTGTNIPQAQVISQMKVLNQDYGRRNADTVSTPDIFRNVAASMNIIFRPVLFDPEGNELTEPGINRFQGSRTVWSPSAAENELMTNAWDLDHYLNIWVVDLSAPNLGFALFPLESGLEGIIDNFSSELKDGMVMDYESFGSNFTGDGTFNLKASFAKGRTATHEVGHYLGLKHPWGDSPFCEVDDFCEDTPLTRVTHSGIRVPCNSDINDCVDPGEDLPDMYQNFMTFADDDCMNIFTKCQVDRMSVVLENAIRRRTLNELAPNAPTDILAAYNEGSVTISWQDNANDEVLYIIERADSANGEFVEVGRVAADVTTFTDTNALLVNTEDEFVYRVYAVNLNSFSQNLETVVNSVTGIEDQLDPQRITIYPNPSQAIFQISVNEPIRGNSQLKVFSTSGKLIKNQMIDLSIPSASFDLNLAAQPQGLYILQILSEEGNLMKKVLKQ